MSDRPHRFETSKDFGVIADRPQISVGVNGLGEAVISTAGIDDGFREIEHREVYIPGESLREVIKMLEAAATELGV